MTHIIDDQQVEKTGEINAIVLDRTMIPTGASTTVMTVTSTSQYIFTGSTVGKIMQLPNATTLLPGLMYTFWNQSTVLVTIKLNDTTSTLFTVSAGEQVTTILQDNSTSNGTWVFARRSSTASSMPMHFGQTTAGANYYLFESTSSKTTTDVLSPPFARNCIILGYAFNCTVFTVGKSMIIRDAANLGVNKAKIDLLTQTQSDWNNAGFTTFAAKTRPAIYLQRNLRQQVIATPTIPSGGGTWIQTINGTSYTHIYPTQAISVTWTRTNNTTYTVIINGVSCAYTSDASATDAEISAGLSSAINTLVGAAVTATNAKPMIVTADVVGVNFTYSGTNVTITDTTPSTNATAVCNGLRSLIAADPLCTVTGSGTTTLIMTGPVNGDSFTYSGSANLAQALQAPFNDGTTITEPRFVMYYAWTD